VDSRVIMVPLLLLLNLFSPALASPQVGGIGTRIPANCVTNSGDVCVFPFRYKGKVYNECTYEDSASAWCALQVDANKDVITNRWADCDTSSSSRCPVETPVCTMERLCGARCRSGETWQVDCNTCICTSKGYTQCTENTCSTNNNNNNNNNNASQCKTISGPSVGKACVFPFSWAGKTYTACTPWIWGGSNQGNLWCSTRTDSDGNHVNGEGEYGFCSAACNDDVDISGIGQRFGGGGANSDPAVLFPADNQDLTRVFPDTANIPS